MNLGEIYLKTALVLFAGSLGLGFLVAILWRLCRKIGWPTIVGITILGGLLAPLALTCFHRPLFTAWHWQQNEFVPKTGCLTYEPEWSRLYATFKMDRSTFEKWVEDHPWPLEPNEDDGYFKAHDGPRFAIEAPEVSFATEPAPNGKQLRVYYKNGVMYLAYNSM